MERAPPLAMPTARLVNSACGVCGTDSVHDVLAHATPVEPVTLDLDGGPVADATVLGWGMDEQGDYPRRLMGSQIQVVADDACNIGIKAVYAKAQSDAIRDNSSWNLP